MIKFFSKEEERQIIDAIQEAERQTSGEIRVHVEGRMEAEEIMDEALKTFAQLKMHETEQRNGVLIFLAPKERSFVILGDEGIDKLVPEHFWEDVRDIMQHHFRENAFAKGICEGVARVGEKLKTYFPYQKDDINELPDDISFGKDSSA